MTLINIILYKTVSSIWFISQYIKLHILVILHRYIEANMALMYISQGSSSIKGGQSNIPHNYPDTDAAILVNWYHNMNVDMYDEIQKTIHRKKQKCLLWTSRIGNYPMTLAQLMASHFQSCMHPVEHYFVPGFHGHLCDTGCIFSEHVQAAIYLWWNIMVSSMSYWLCASFILHAFAWKYKTLIIITQKLNLQRAL